ncbi:kelch-like protein 25 isoform X3 [Myripristis murdjan]|uniref:kelch-like protein 25 isoform X3 n=1 Tax=Myripristis murdjan TaxID=586833 RepID=UPI001175F4E8|nr:kelch-like protein 25 isoform X3 [Myripristis murdjan]
MSVSVHENRKSRTSTGSMNISLFHKPSHPDSVLTHLNTLRKQSMFTDVTLWAGDRSFPCHRAVLAACSRYFEAMFSGGLRESLDSDVNFRDNIHPEVLELLLDFAYSSRLIINEENAESLLEAGDMLQFHDIRDAAAEFLEKNLHSSNCLGMMLLSDAHQCKRLYELSWRMCLVHYETVRESEEFYSLSKDKLLELILSDELEIEDEQVDHKAKEIIPKQTFLAPEKEFSACAIGCKVYVTGGRGSENGVRKMSGSMTLSIRMVQRAPMLIARFGHGSAELENSLYVVGGHTAIAGVFPASPSVSLKQVERYDPLCNKWTMMAPLRDGVSNAAVVSAKLKLFVFGGTTIHRDKASKVQCYDPVGNRWNIAAECPQPWRYTAAAVLGSQIFIMGGDTEFTAASAYRFDCDTNQWTRVGDMTSKRMSCHAVASGNKLYVVGGYFGTQRCKTLDCYDPTSDSWNSITTVPYSLIPTAFVSTWKHLPA